MKNGHQILDWITELVSPSPTGTVTVAPLVFTADHATVKHLTRSHFTIYQKGFILISALHDFLDDVIVNVNGDSWCLRHKIASFEFSSRSLRAFVLETVRQEIANATKTGSILDLQDALKRFSFDNICSHVFNADPAVLGEVARADGDRFYHAFEEAANLSIQRLAYPSHWMWKLMWWLNTGSEHRL